MPIVMNDLLAFNNVETTDPVVAVAQLPFFKDAPYRPNYTYSIGYDEFIRGNNGRGSQVIIRELGKGTVTKVKATASGAFDYTHANTSDTVVVVSLDDVLKQSEKIYEAVDVARQSSTGAMKAEVVLSNLIDKQQETISGYLQGAVQTASATTAITTAAALKTDLIENYAKALDIKPTRLMVSRDTLALLLQLTTGDGFVANPSETVIRTGVVGTILGMDVIVDENLDSAVVYVMYNHNKFFVFPVLEKLSIVQAIDFDGSYARGIMLLGGYGANKAKGSGSWGVKRTVAGGS